jgi:hypothetical protein
MIAPGRQSKTMSRSLQVAGWIMLTLLILWLRRPVEFSAPYIWAESGSVSLRDFAAHGWLAIFTPVNGYYVTIEKLIALPSFTLSIGWAPELILAATVLFTAAVVAAIALAPTHLRWKPLCAVSCLLVPTNPEVFGIAINTIWWAGLLLVLALVWNAAHNSLWPRLGLVMLGGLSSSIIVPLSALFVLRAVLERQRTEWIIAAVAVAVAALQLVPILNYTSVDDATVLSWAVWKLPGYAAFPRAPSDNVAIWLGLAASLVFGALVLSLRNKLDRYFWLLLMAAVLIVAITLIRIPVTIIHPAGAAPRYFFYPFILGSWLLIWIAAVSGPILRTAALAALAVSIVQGFAHFARYTEPLDWRAQIAACTNSREYFLPIHFDGSTKHLWYLPLTGERCRELIDRSLF